MPSAAPRIETVGPTAPKQGFSRWLVLHVKSKLEHTTKDTAQYAHGALALAIEEGFGARLLENGFDFPTMNDVEFVELDQDTDAARVDASLGRIA